MTGSKEQTGDSSQKREKFKQLAERRTTKALEAILRIGNLSNRQAYEFDEADVRKIVRALREAVTAVENRFESPKRNASSGFKL